MGDPLLVSLNPPHPPFCANAPWPTTLEKQLGIAICLGYVPERHVLCGCIRLRWIKKTNACGVSCTLDTLLFAFAFGVPCRACKPQRSPLNYKTPWATLVGLATRMVATHGNHYAWTHNVHKCSDIKHIHFIVKRHL